jgi:hypothetical protein
MHQLIPPRPMALHAHRTPSLDVIGATTSLVCAVHCAALAVLLGIAPALDVLAQPWVDWCFLGASTLVGLAALVPGYRRHRHPLPPALFIGGIAALFFTRLLRVPPSALELSIVLVAASALIAAHWANRRALRLCCGGENTSTTVPRTA